jgi:hypothetical protein
MMHSKHSDAQHSKHSYAHIHSEQQHQQQHTKISSSIQRHSSSITHRHIVMHIGKYELTPHYKAAAAIQRGKPQQRRVIQNQAHKGTQRHTESHGISQRHSKYNNTRYYYTGTQ